MNNIEYTLRKAKDILEYRGWAQGMMENDDGNVCTLGAINLAVDGVSVALTPSGHRDAVVRTVAQILKHHPACYARSITAIAAFNDYVAQSKEEVLDVLDAAIDSVKGSLDGPSRRIHAEPLEQPNTQPISEPDVAPATPQKTPEQVPA